MERDTQKRDYTVLLVCYNIEICRPFKISPVSRFEAEEEKEDEVIDFV